MSILEELIVKIQDGIRQLSNEEEIDTIAIGQLLEAEKYLIKTVAATLGEAGPVLAGSVGAATFTPVSYRPPMEQLIDEIPALLRMTVNKQAEREKRPRLSELANALSILENIKGAGERIVEAKENIKDVLLALTKEMVEELTGGKSDEEDIHPDAVGGHPA